MKERLAMKTILRHRDKSRIISTHPCFSLEAHSRFGRIHLPVAPACNIQCKYCIRKYDCANESRPGITSRVLTPHEALDRVRSLVERNERLTVIGIAGPGDPLANDATFETFSRIHRAYPELTLCVSTNGLLLSDRLDDLVGAGVTSLTVTINAVRPEIAEKIYSWVSYKGTLYKGREAAECLLNNQWEGPGTAVKAGLIVKVNTVFIPGINDEEIPLVSWFAARRGAELMNIMPLIPKAEFEHLRRPSHEALNTIRRKCEKHIPQMTHCRQCRADACGELGEDRDMELEVLHSRIGEEYCEIVN
ncbi:MAG: nitrogenase cofactor biosynthesis protein NifB [Nitrospirae bacterium]|nr:nitrogenase cofactor biosynthesis protein NifB [Nitrospirota bacterium]